MTEKYLKHRANTANMTKVLVGEVKIALFTIKKDIEHGFSKIIMEGDAWNVIDPLSNAGKTLHWSIVGVVTDILDFVKCFDAILFSFVYKGQCFSPSFNPMGGFC